MTNVKVGRGVESNIMFRLRSQEGGSLVDDDQYTDGLTAAQWPAVKIMTLAGVDVTASFAKNIVGDSLPAGWTKHPTTTTGIIRDGAVGKYRIRVIPTGAMALGDYRMEVTADIGGAPYIEEHTFALVNPGDVEFGAEGLYATAEEVLSNFELEGIVTSSQVDKARANADVAVHAYLEKWAIPTPATRRPALTKAAIAFSRAELRRLQSAIYGPGLGVTSVKESDTEYRFASPDKQFQAYYQEFVMWIDLATDAILGGANVYTHRGQMGTAE